MGRSLMSALFSAASGLSFVIGFAIAANAVLIAYIGTFDIAYTRALIVYASVVAVLLARPLAAQVPAERPLLRSAAWLVDFGALSALTGSMWFFLRSADDLINMLVTYDTLDIYVAVLGMIVLLEASRRLFGLPLFLFIVVVFLFGLFGGHLPSAIGHSGFSLSAVMEMVWYGFQGVFGTPLSIIIQVVLIFVVFGAMLEGTGASTSLMRISFAITGRTRGGVGHAAIVSSGLFGSMSGSVVANVVGTGTFTIPMMVRRGFDRSSAGAIEAAASTGGQIMPPVMGAAAFLMADLLGLPYLTICLAALVPALFYYGALFVAVSLEAGRAGMRPIPREERVTVDRTTMIQSLMFVVPMLVIIITLVMGRSPSMAGFTAVVAVLVVSFLLNPELRRHPSILIKAAASGGMAGASIVVAVAAIGIVLAVFNLTGIGLRFASTVASLGEGHLLLALLLTALTCLILGMGMPTLPAYLIIVLVMGRSLRELGVEPLAIHLFVFYFGVLSAITPPVAVAVFAAVPIANSHPIATGIVALRLAFIGFIIPFVFAIEPSLLIVSPSFDLTQFFLAVIGLIVAIIALSTAFYAYDGGPLAPLYRLLRLVLGLAPLAALIGNMFETMAVLGSALCLGANMLMRARKRESLPKHPLEHMPPR